MKMKYKLYIVIFMVMCILPFAGMAVAKTEITTENRQSVKSPHKAIKDMIKVVFHLLMKRFRMISRIALIEGLTDSLPKLL